MQQVYQELQLTSRALASPETSQLTIEKVNKETEEVVSTLEAKLFFCHQTGIMVVDNFFTKEECETLIQIGEDHPHYWRHESDFARNYVRIYPSDQLSYVPEMIDAGSRVATHTGLMQASEALRDLSWKGWRPNIQFGWEIQWTKYKTGGEQRYTWHVDTAHQRLLNYICYMTDDFEGGETQIAIEHEYNKPDDKLDEYQVLHTVEPKQGRLLIMPSWLIHRVLPTKKGGDRITLNGHIRSG